MTSQLYVKKSLFLPDQYDATLAIGLSCHICNRRGELSLFEKLEPGKALHWASARLLRLSSLFVSGACARTKFDEPNSKSCFSLTSEPAEASFFAQSFVNLEVSQGYYPIAGELGACGD